MGAVVSDALADAVELEVGDATMGAVVSDTLAVAVEMEPGETHFVQMVEVEVLRTVESTVVTC